MLTNKKEIIFRVGRQRFITTILIIKSQTNSKVIGQTHLSVNDFCSNILEDVNQFYIIRNLDSKFLKKYFSKDEIDTTIEWNSKIMFTSSANFHSNDEYNEELAVSIVIQKLKRKIYKFKKQIYKTLESIYLEKAKTAHRDICNSEKGIIYATEKIKELSKS